MSTTQVNSNASGNASVDMKLEVVTIPVSDVDRATEFYVGLGWRRTSRPPALALSSSHRPAPSCSVQFGTNRTSAAPGSAQNMFLIVSDIQAACDYLVGRGVEVSEVFHLGPDGQVSGAGSRAPQLRLVGHVQRSGRQPLAAPGDHHSAARPHRFCRRRRSVRRVIWRMRCGARRSPTATTSSASARRTRTGPTGTPHTWLRSRAARNCQQ